MNSKRSWEIFETCRKEPSVDTLVSKILEASDKLTNLSIDPKISNPHIKALTF
jgi:hypothetical protein